MIPIDKITPGENCPKVVNAIIEIPKGSINKYEIDKSTGMLKLDRPMYSAVHYPGDYGFIPQTLWKDNDPMDILVITSKPVYPMTLARVKVIGVLKMIDSGEEDDKIIGVYESDPRFKDVDDISQLPKYTVEKIKHFFKIYKELYGKKCSAEEILGKEEAYKCVTESVEMYKKSLTKAIEVHKN